MTMQAAGRRQVAGAVRALLLAGLVALLPARSEAAPAALVSVLVPALEPAAAAPNLVEIGAKKKGKKKGTRTPKAGGKAGGDVASADNPGSPGGKKKKKKKGKKAGHSGPDGQSETASDGPTKGRPKDRPKDEPKDHKPPQGDGEPAAGGQDQAGSDDQPIDNRPDTQPEGTPDVPNGGDDDAPPVIVTDNRRPHRFVCERDADRRCMCARVRTPKGIRVLTLRCAPREGDPAPGEHPGGGPLGDLPQSVAVPAPPPAWLDKAPPPVVATGDPEAIAAAFVLAEARAKQPATPPGTVGAPTAPAGLTGEVLCALLTSAPVTTEDDIASSLNLTVLTRENLDLIGLRVVRLGIPDGRPVGDVIARLRGDPRLVTWQPNFIYRRQGGDDAGEIAAGELQYALAKIGAGDAQTLATGRGVRVAVIDTGVDASHPDLAGAVVAAFDATGSSEPILDDHGTAIAGIVRANGLTRGVAPDAEILSARAFAPVPGAPSEQATTYSVLKAIDWAMAERARVLNMSFAGARDGLLGRAVAAAVARGAIVVAAAGNEGTVAPPAYPAAYPDVIAVTATDIADRLYREANRGAYITLAAPGVDVLVPSLGGVHDLKSGTSFAAAVVSGIAALMLERDPDLTPGELRSRLQQAARDLGPTGFDIEFGAGLIDAEAALAALAGKDTAGP